ncbi:MAG: hypothetical protein SH850_13990 [Planctomycetaceae bacterium]|nr:hypothetical protein [Planctomycetaceae bacterium]
MKPLVDVARFQPVAFRLQGRDFLSPTLCSHATQQVMRRLRGRRRFAARQRLQCVLRLFEPQFGIRELGEDRFQARIPVADFLRQFLLLIFEPGSFAIQFCLQLFAAAFQLFEAEFRQCGGNGLLRQGRDALTQRIQFLDRSPAPALEFRLLLSGFVSRVPFIQSRLQDASGFLLGVRFQLGVFLKLVDLSRNFGFRDRRLCGRSRFVLLRRGRLRHN